MCGSITGIDTAGRTVLIGNRRIPYDLLIIATGVRESYFGHDEWAVTSRLKTIWLLMLATWDCHLHLSHRAGPAQHRANRQLSLSVPDTTAVIWFLRAAEQG
jgi:NADH dehydrogenase FAD-containing subunit